MPRRSASACSATRSWARRTPTATRSCRTWPGRRRCSRGSSRSPAATRRRWPKQRVATASSGYVTDWHELVADPDVQLLDNSGPNNLHAEPTIAAAEAGKHVFCEKPLGRTADESHEIWQRVAATGVQHMTAFNYRFVPAVRLARQMIEAGELGEIHHFRGRYLQEWGTTTADAWRFHKERGRLRRARRPRRARDRPRALPRRRDHDRLRLDARRSCRAARSTTRSRRSSSSRTARSGRSRPSRFAAGRKNALQLGDQRHEGLTRVRPGAPERASALGRDEGLSHDPRHGGRPPVLAVVVAARPHHRLGAHVRPRDPPSADAIAGEGTVAPHGATFEDGYRAAEVCDAVLRSAESGRREAISYRSA